MSANPHEPSSANRFALVTGAGSGSGRAIAIALAEDGCDVGILGRRTEALEETATAIRALGRRAG